MKITRFEDIGQMKAQLEICDDTGSLKIQVQKTLYGTGNSVPQLPAHLEEIVYQ